MASNDNEWELSKENVQPLKHGRKVSDLTTALQPSSADPDRTRRFKEQKKAFEMELRVYEGNDPFDVWDRYIKWTEQTFPSGGSNSQLLPLLKSCVTTFNSDERYRNDQRYIAAWIKFANLVTTPMDVFNYLHDNNLGTKVSTVYHAWACELEKQGSIRRADAIYVAGIENGAEPLDWLKCRHRDFEARTLRTMVEKQDSGEPSSPESEHRTTLGQLKANKKGHVGSMRTGSSKMHDKSGLAQKSMPKSAQIQSNKTQFQVYSEDNQPPLSLPAPRHQRNIPDYSQMNRENEQTPVVWTSARAKQQQSLIVREAANTSRPSFSIHEDDDAQPTQTPRKLPEVGNKVLSTRKPEKPRSAIDDIRNTTTQLDPNQIVMYRRELIYCGNSELTFEELRATKWWLKHEAPKRERELQQIAQERERLREEREQFRREQERVSQVQHDELFLASHHHSNDAETSRTSNISQLMPRSSSNTPPFVTQSDDVEMSDPGAAENVHSPRYSRSVETRENRRNCPIRNFDQQVSNSMESESNDRPEQPVSHFVNTQSEFNNRNDSDNYSQPYFPISSNENFASAANSLPNTRGLSNENFAFATNLSPNTQGLSDENFTSATNTLPNNQPLSNETYNRSATKLSSDNQSVFNANNCTPNNSTSSSHISLSVPSIHVSEHGSTGNLSIFGKPASLQGLHGSLITPDNSLIVMNNTGSGGTSSRSFRTPGSGSFRMRDSMVAPSPTIHTKAAYQMMMGTGGIFNSSLAFDNPTHSSDIAEMADPEPMLGATAAPPPRSTIKVTRNAQSNYIQKVAHPSLAIHCVDEPKTIEDRSLAFDIHHDDESNQPLLFAIHCDDGSDLPMNKERGLPFAIHCDNVSDRPMNKERGLPFAIHCDDGSDRPMNKEGGLPFAIHCDDGSDQPMNKEGGLPFAIHCDDQNCLDKENVSHQLTLAVQDDIQHIPAPSENDYQGVVYDILPNDVPDYSCENQIGSRKSLGLPLAGTIARQCQDSTLDARQLIDDTTIDQPGSMHDFIQHAHMASTPFIPSKPNSSQTQLTTDSGVQSSKNERSCLSDLSSGTDFTISRNLALSSVQEVDKNPHNLSPILEGSDEVCSSTSTSSHATTNNTTSSRSGSEHSTYGNQSAHKSGLAGKSVQHMKSISEAKNDLMDCMSGMLDDSCEMAEDVFTSAQRADRSRPADSKASEYNQVGVDKFAVNGAVFGGITGSFIDRNIETQLKTANIRIENGLRTEMTSSSRRVNCEFGNNSAPRSNVSLQMDDMMHDVDHLSVSLGNISMEYVENGDQNSNDELSMSIMIDPVNPFADKTIEKQLDGLICKIKTWPSYHQINGKFPELKDKSRTNICLDGAEYQIEKVLDVGGYATVYQGERFHFNQSHLKTEKCALKVQTPTFLWEYYIMKEVQSRLALSTVLHDRDADVSLCDVKEGYFYDDKSCLVIELYTHGTLLAFVNNYRLNKHKMSLEPFATYVIIELLCIVEQLHACNIIHGDIKPDNFVIMKKSPKVQRSNDPDIVFGTKTQMLKLIDFGQAIDMTLYPSNMTFKSKVETEGFQCVEMHEGRPWTYQLDLYAVLGTIHVVIFKEYMKIYQSQGIYKPTTSIPRGWNVELWKNLFHTFLNIPDSQHLPNISEIRRSFEQHFIRSDFASDFQKLIVHLNSTQ